MSQDSANLNTSKSSECLPAFTWLAVFPLGITPVKHLATISCFVKTEAVEVVNSGISLYLLLLAFPLLDVILCLLLCPPFLVYLQYLFLGLFLFFDSCYSFCTLAFLLNHLHEISSKLRVLVSTFSTPDFQIIAGNKSLLCCDFLFLSMM